MPAVPPSARRFWPTLRVASFGACAFPDGDAGGAPLNLPLLEQLSLMNVGISESSLHSMLAGCPALKSLVVTESIGSCSRIRIASRTLRSVAVQNSWGEIRLEQIIIGDAPCLERLLLFGDNFRKEMVISVVSAPKLEIFGQLPALCPRLEFGATIFQSTKPRVTNAWRRKYQNLISTLDIRLKKIVVTTYQGNKAHVNFANFFVLNARVLQSMVLEADVSHNNDRAWIERQNQLLQIENRASKAARFDFVFHFGWPRTLEYIWSDQVHDLSTADPFVGFDKWAKADAYDLIRNGPHQLQSGPAKSSGREESSGSSRRPSPLPFPKPSPAAAHPPSRGAMETISRGKKSNHGEDDRISRLPDAILEDIISLLPTKDGGRTQVLSSRWRPLWRSAPLNVDIHDWYLIPKQRLIRAGEISGILSSHLGPAGRRFSIPTAYLEENKSDPAATLDGWLRSPALDGLQELEFHYGFWSVHRKPPLPPSARRFSPTLRVASFGACSFQGSALQMPLLEQLSLKNVGISESSLHAMLAGCPALKSLMLTQSVGSCSRIRIVSRTLRSIGVHLQSFWGQIRLQQLIIEDAPCLERLLLFGEGFGEQMVILVVSAPKLKIFGQLPVQYPRLEFGATIFQGSSVVNSTMVMPSVKVLALTHANLSLDVVIDFMKCFPCLENLYIKINKEDSNNNNQQVSTHAL
ncbi:hypothetical protein HU200_027895 [Digitaria exilis]|uniref:F-box domain-containing protein n=1 Tax=Digitaria exilis TaxID=1010633 RepID=A0A835C479_9POAL|nr:hypothetical protein HU200_027895 [Digitaria exilis]